VTIVGGELAYRRDKNLLGDYKVVSVEKKRYYTQEELGS